MLPPVTSRGPGSSLARASCTARVTEGRMVRNANIRVMRDGAAIAEATIASLRHFREEVNEITNGMECGITLQGFNDFQEGDILEAYRQERSQR